MVTNFGLRNEQTTKYFAERARGGAGLIIVHGTPVDLFLNFDWARRLSQLVKAVHDEGAKIAIQLWHGNDLNRQPVAPSIQGPCRPITREEIRTVVAKFATAASHCQEVGFDGAEVHGAHGYFIHQFFSPLTNQRIDEYGGPVENRMRLALELIAAMRRAVEERQITLYEDPWAQLQVAIQQVLGSWDSTKAKQYREIMDISDSWGTAVILQAMVFGNLSLTSGSGVVFTAHPYRKIRRVALWGDFTPGNQGEDIVGGLVSTYPISREQKEMDEREGGISLEEDFLRR
ncbi:MAG: PEP/pyruvate-binding domain-containing protein, partial [Thermodesulfobacteriota bacterium]